MQNMTTIVSSALGYDDCGVSHDKLFFGGKGFCAIVLTASCETFERGLTTVCVFSPEQEQSARLQLLFSVFSCGLHIFLSFVLFGNVYYSVAKGSKGIYIPFRSVICTFKPNKGTLLLSGFLKCIPDFVFVSI